MLSFTIGASTISVFIDGIWNSIDSSHINHPPLLEELKKPQGERDLEAIRNLISVKKMLEILSLGRVTVMEDSILYDDVEVNNYMTARMLDLIHQGFDITPWAAFMDNVHLNPATYAHSELYEWMEKADMPITTDGCFLAFKKVKADFTDCHTGEFDNSPGTLLEMDREACDPVRTNHCSSGFHFCSAGYLKNFHGRRVVVCKINPKDVTSIPNDYSFTKGRTCRYEVIAELSSESAAYSSFWKAGLIDFDDPAELPGGFLKNVKFPPAGVAPVRAASDPADDALLDASSDEKESMEANEASIRIEEETTDAGKVTLTLSVNIGETTFSTKDGRSFTKSQITAALKDESIRGAARLLGIQDSTLRGWKKVLGL